MPSAGGTARRLLERGSNASGFVAIKGACCQLCDLMTRSRLFRIYVTRPPLTVSDLRIMLKGLWADSNRNTECVASALRILTKRERTAGVEPEIRNYSAGS